MVKAEPVIDPVVAANSAVTEAQQTLNDLIAQRDAVADREDCRARQDRLQRPRRRERQGENTAFSDHPRAV
jgi:hypothetical protein